MALQFLTITSPFFQTGTYQLSYEFFGLPVGTAPVILVNHALTGNSTVVGQLGWWNDLVGSGKVINTDKYTVLAINIPGNGYDKNAQNLISNYQAFSTKIIAHFFWEVIDKLNITKLFAVVGGSLGGAIAWEMAFLRPTQIQKLIPIATNYKASDWLIGQVLVQESILNNSKNPIHDARKHAMLLYRCPEGINQKFQTEWLSNTNQFKVENWLHYHADALYQRFTLPAYQLMNHLLKTIGRHLSTVHLAHWAIHFTGEVHIIAINSDLLFTANEQVKTYQFLKNSVNAQYSEISSIHGHDAFLIEFNQISQFINTHF